MKKIACMFAAGVLAFGATAKADQVASTEYAVITIPVVAGTNLVGVSVSTPSAGTSLSSILPTLDPATKVLIPKPDGTGYTNPSASGATVKTGDSVFLPSSSTGPIYQLGPAPENVSVPAVTVAGLGLVSSPYASGWALSSLTFSSTGGKTYAKSNKVHVWDASTSQYVTYWEKNVDGVKTWRNKLAPTADVPTIGAGQGVFVELGNSLSTGTVGFAVPQ